MVTALVVVLRARPGYLAQTISLKLEEQGVPLSVCHLYQMLTRAVLLPALADWAEGEAALTMTALTVLLVALHATVAGLPLRAVEG